MNIKTFYFFSFKKYNKHQPIFLQTCIEWNVFSLTMSPFAGHSIAAMEMLSRISLTYCNVRKNESASCRSLLTLCKWLLADWKDMTPQLKQASLNSPTATALLLHIQLLACCDWKFLWVIFVAFLGGKEIGSGELVQRCDQHVSSEPKHCRFAGVSAGGSRHSPDQCWDLR